MSSRRYARRRETRRYASRPGVWAILSVREAGPCLKVLEAWYRYSGPSTPAAAMLFALANYFGPGLGEVLEWDSCVVDIYLLCGTQDGKVKPHGFNLTYLHPAYRKLKPLIAALRQQHRGRGSRGEPGHQGIGAPLPNEVLLLTAADACWEEIGLEPPRPKSETFHCGISS
jgi:hypothetical protein